MPDTNPALAKLLGQEIPCPCNRGYMLKDDLDRARGHCVLCHMLSPGFRVSPKPTGAARQWADHLSRYASGPAAFRSEAETYGEGVFDDD